MGMKTFSLFLLAIVSLVQVSCKCSRTSEIIGPDACPSDQFVPGTFTIRDNAEAFNDHTLDLANSFAKINATFNESISYQLTISGTPSGAVYVLKGSGSTVDVNWYGNSTNGKYFKQGDVLAVRLTNVCKQEPLGADETTIGTTVGYTGFGLKAINYEEDPAIYDATPYGDAGKPNYGSSRFMTPASAGYLASPQGGNYYKFKVDSVSSTANKNAAGKNVSWSFGGVDFNIASQVALLGDDPSNVYLNFFARGQANSQALMIIDESAHGVNLRRKFPANVGPEWTLYSVKLSDIGVLKPSSISTFAFNMGAATYQDTSAEVDLDLVIFTIGKPL